MSRISLPHLVWSNSPLLNYAHSRAINSEHRKSIRYAINDFAGARSRESLESCSTTLLGMLEEPDIDPYDKAIAHHILSILNVSTRKVASHARQAVFITYGLLREYPHDASLRSWRESLVQVLETSHEAALHFTETAATEPMLNVAGRTVFGALRNWGIFKDEPTLPVSLETSQATELSTRNDDGETKTTSGAKIDSGIHARRRKNVSQPRGNQTAFE